MNMQRSSGSMHQNVKTVSQYKRIIENANKKAHTKAVYSNYLGFYDTVIGIMDTVYGHDQENYTKVHTIVCSNILTMKIGKMLSAHIKSYLYSKKNVIRYLPEDELVKFVEYVTDINLLIGNEFNG